MRNARLNLTLLLDGFVAWPNESAHHPSGIPGVQLHQWRPPPRTVFRETHGEAGGEINPQHALAEEILDKVGRLLPLVDRGNALMLEGALADTAHAEVGRATPSCRTS